MWTVGLVGGCLFSLLAVTCLFMWNKHQELEAMREANTQLAARLAAADAQLSATESQLHDVEVDLAWNERLRAESAAAARLSSRSEDVMDIAASDWMPFIATWYSPAGGEGDGTVTATGTRVRDNWTIAVDPRVIPLGSLVEVRFPDGRRQLFQALDTGGAIVGRHIDIFNHSEATCIRNGVQRVELRILIKGAPVSLADRF